ncbi:unnamed protein product [Ixodes persulcatus]
MRFTMVVCFSALLVSVATREARARGPECPLVKCGDGLKVACFVGKETCYCHCVKTDDPCESVEQEPCPEGHNECSAQDISCQCRCVPD